MEPWSLHKGIGEFVELLAGYEIEALVEVEALSRFSQAPHFNQERLSASLGSAGIEYSP